MNLQSCSRVFHLEHKQIAFVAPAYPQLAIDESRIKLSNCSIWSFDWNYVEDFELNELDKNFAFGLWRQSCRDRVEEGPSLVVPCLERRGICISVSNLLHLIK